IIPQPVTLKFHNVMTLNDLQKLLGPINWLRPILGITTEELHPLFTLLKGDPNLLST
ncbi:POK6 protein, partial [Alopecoenas beccarii]|nr:POK6 protein [Alopecoenas beccarii]